MRALSATSVPILLGGLVAAIAIAGSLVVAAIAVLRSRKASGRPPEL